MRKRTYQEPVPLPREEAEGAFASGDPGQIAHALVCVAFHEADWRWVQGRCLGFARHDVAAVRQIAVTCLGHVARIHRQLDLTLVLPALHELSRDPGVRVEDALDDIQMFVGRGWRGHICAGGGITKGLHPAAGTTVLICANRSGRLPGGLFGHGAMGWGNSSI